MTTEGAGSRGNIADRVVDDYSGFKVYDERGEKLGKVEYTILDANEQPEYLGVNTGFFGTKTTLIPEEIVRLDDRDRSFSVQASDGTVKDAPTFEHHDEITTDYEDHVRQHYGLGGSGTSSSSSGDTDYDHTSQDRTEEARRDESIRDDRAAAESSGHERSEPRTSDVGDSYTARQDDRSTDVRSDHESSTSPVSAAGAASAPEDRDRHSETRDSDELGHRDEARQTSRQDSGEREQVRVTLKREKAHAERIINEDGEEEVRIRKTTVTEETLVDVEDPKH